MPGGQNECVFLQYGCFQKPGVPQNGWFISWKTLLKWMIWVVFPLFLEIHIWSLGNQKSQCSYLRDPITLSQDDWGVQSPPQQSI